MKDEINTRILYKEPDYKSVICFSENCRICSIKKFSWFQKKMLKLVFGIVVLNYER